MARWQPSEHVQHCLVVRDDSVHRVQETQAALGHALWHAVQERIGAGALGISEVSGG